ncbi:hypothetical protein [Streptomyces monashensis]|uniref:Uncharacterized protein n=1 Tax=Streptomyces monashensis TaxID=1678012 RepID=A0A1S2QEJ3_9ACTN|nr:hypothetical protein [Streptomyces monashensis]OIK04494.1 hypothetical protein BIV23_17205 [Streptomyces monashensis]
MTSTSIRSRCRSGYARTTSTTDGALETELEIVRKAATFLGEDKPAPKGLDPAFTLRTYTHFMPEAGARGLAVIETWFADLAESP